MGRRKIEIRAIKDDRNRSVTFLKRKGGLFKKAHELSVLCSVDVAVIIFGHNKKLYQFSSGDINDTLRRYQYYGPPHEHKGPADFKNKSGGDDDDEEEEEDDNNIHREDSLPPQQSMMPPHLQHGSFHHIRQPGTSASPPMGNGMFSRTTTPQPQHPGSRPSSRNAFRRQSSNLVPVQHPHATPPPPSGGFAYTPNLPIYNPAANAPPLQPSPQPQYQQQFTQQPPPPPHQPMQQQQQQQYIPEPQNHPPPTQNEQFQPPLPITRVSPPAQQQDFRPPESIPPQIKHLSSNAKAKSRSIFTPIEDGSVLAAHFFGAPDPPRSHEALKKENSPEAKRTARAPPPPLPNARPIPPQPRQSSGLAHEFRPPQRSDTNSSSKSGSRPKLNLTIPSEASDDELSNSPGHRSAGNSANPGRPNGGNGSGEHHNNLILPPPSPSASAVMSAGAVGPRNPFARPPPPSSQNNNAYSENRNNNLETPISALPSRYMDQDLLASPGGLFGSWANFGGSSTILPSPNVSTPLTERTLPGGFGRGEKREGEDGLVGEGKRIKT